MGEGGELGEEMDGTKRMVGREGGGGGLRRAWEWEEVMGGVLSGAFITFLLW